MIPYGSCVSWRVPPEQNKFIERIFGWLQNKITGEPETHCSMIMSPYPEKGIGWYYEYELSVTARVSLYEPNSNSTIYDILAPTEIKYIALNLLMEETKGDFYGVLQTIAFVVRAVIEKFGGDGRRIWNPFPWLGICSEGMYDDLYGVAWLMGWDDLLEYMDEWSPDVFHSGDARLVLEWMVKRGYAKRIWN